MKHLIDHEAVIELVKALEEIDTLMLGSHHPASGAVMAQVRRGIRAIAPVLSINKEALHEQGLVA